MSVIFQFSNAQQFRISGLYALQISHLTVIAFMNFILISVTAFSVCKFFVSNRCIVLTRFSLDLVKCIIYSTRLSMLFFFFSGHTGGILTAAMSNTFPVSIEVTDTMTFNDVCRLFCQDSSTAIHKSIFPSA